MSKSFRNAINTQLAGLQGSETLANKILEHAGPARPNAHKPYTVSIAVCLCAIFVLSVATATIPAMRNFLRGAATSSESRQVTAVTANGIQIKVVSVSHESGQYNITMQVKDVEKDRLGSTMQVQAMISGIQKDLDASVADYDPGTKTATLKVLVPDADAPADGKLSLQVTNILGEKKNTTPFDTGVDLATVAENVPTKTLMLSDAHKGLFQFSLDNRANNETLKDHASTLRMQAWLDQGGVELLEPGPMHIDLPGIDDAYISNMGFVNGELHVQVYHPDDSANREAFFADGQLCLNEYSDDPLQGPRSILFNVDAEGNPVDRVSFAEGVGPNVDYSNPDSYHYDVPTYVEFIFEDDKADLAGSKLIGYFPWQAQLKGNWQITVDLTGAAEVSSE